MQRLIVAAALLCACRGGHDDAGRKKPASSVSVVPKLPMSEDGATALRMLDKQLAVGHNDPGGELGLLLQRAAIRGKLEDYQTALAHSEAWLAKAPTDPAAWKLRVRVLSAVHRFADARAVLEQARPLVPADEVQELATALDEATGHLERSAPAREAAAKANPNPANLTLWAANLALLGRFDEAIALIPKAAAAVHDNPASLLTWLLFQWGRLYEQKGELAAARQLFEASRARMPGSVETIAHLAQAEIATGDPAAAKRLVDAALADNRQPTLLALAAQLDAKPEKIAAARTEWERYVAALPDAFSDHAARFYIGPGGDPARALELANANFANRDTREARALVVEAALAAGNAARACEVATPLAEPVALRAQRFLAWRALSQCGKTAEADRLAAELGIAH